MKIEQANHVRDLLNEKDRLKKLLDIASNYDFDMSVRFSSGHNNNTKVYIERFITAPQEMRVLMMEYVKTRLAEIEAEIQKT